VREKSLLLRVAFGNAKIKSKFLAKKEWQIAGEKSAFTDWWGFYEKIRTEFRKNS